MSQRDNSPFFDCRWDMTRESEATVAHYCARGRGATTLPIGNVAWGPSVVNQYAGAGTRERGCRCRRCPTQRWEVPLASDRSVRTTGTRRADLCSDIVSSIALSPLPPPPPRSLWNVTSYRVSYQHKQPILLLAAAQYFKDLHSAFGLR